jgi:Leucine-rich repeat (LRR) protein
MSLAEVPSELFRLKNLNYLCSLPSKIAHLAMLELLYVRSSKRFHRDVTLFQVAGNQLTSLPPELGLLANLKLLSVRHSWQMDRDLTMTTPRPFRPKTTSSRRCQRKSAG